MKCYLMLDVKYTIGFNLFSTQPLSVISKNVINCYLGINSNICDRHLVTLAHVLNSTKIGKTPYTLTVSEEAFLPSIISKMRPIWR